MDPFANRSSKAFAAQFAPDGNSYLFRPDHVGAAVRVTVQERDEAIAAFRDAFYDWRHFVISGVFAVAVVIATNLASGASGKVMLIAFLGSIIARGVVENQAYRAPAKRFADRAPEEPHLTKEEARTVKDRQIAWTGIAVTGFFGALLTYWLATSPTNDANLIMLLAGPAFVAMVPYGIWRKFRSA